jgi:protein involved in temperature-dependent protein secretion
MAGFRGYQLARSRLKITAGRDGVGSLPVDPVDDALERGDFVQAAQIAEARVRGQPAPETWLQIFKIRAMLCEFDVAAQALAQVARLKPDLGPGLDLFRSMLELDRFLFWRLRDPGTAANRASHGPPPMEAMMQVKASWEHASGNFAAAAATLREAAQAHQPTPGRLVMWNGSTRDFDDIRDADALTGACMPSAGGPQGPPVDLWFAMIHRIEFEPPRAHIDQLYLPANVVPRQGAPMRVRIPPCYPGFGIHPSPDVRLGQNTLFDHANGYAIASGQRDYHVDSAFVGISRIQSIVFR